MVSAFAYAIRIQTSVVLLVLMPISKSDEKTKAEKQVGK